MLLSLNWLKDYLLKSDLKIDPKDLAQKLTMRGLAVASITKPQIGLENVIVGRIERIDKHPNADRLQITWVATAEERSETDLPRDDLPGSESGHAAGAGSEPRLRQIVCGA